MRARALSCLLARHITKRVSREARVSNASSHHSPIHTGGTPRARQRRCGKGLVWRLIPLVSAGQSRGRSTSTYEMRVSRFLVSLSGISPYRPTPIYRAIEALIRDWQFLESLGMGPIQLVGEDEEEEQEAKVLQAKHQQSDAGDG